MYFGNKGLLEYDGTSWNTINTTNSSTIRSMDMDTNGIKYIGAVNEFGYVDITDQGQLRYKSLLSKVPPDLHEFGNVWTTNATNFGVFFLTDNNLYRFG